jgi:hypothetical protein
MRVRIKSEESKKIETLYKIPNGDHIILIFKERKRSIQRDDWDEFDGILAHETVYTKVSFVADCLWLHEAIPGISFMDTLVTRKLNSYEIKDYYDFIHVESNPQIYNEFKKKKLLKKGDKILSPWNLKGFDKETFLKCNQNNLQYRMPNVYYEYNAHLNDPSCKKQLLKMPYFTISSAEMTVRRNIKYNKVLPKTLSILYYCETEAICCTKADDPYSIRISDSIVKEYSNTDAIWDEIVNEEL